MTDEYRAPLTPALCSRCRTSLAEGMLRCPSCRALVHADHLAELARQADAAAGEGELARATDLWHRALALLPAGAAQRGPIDAKLHQLGERMERGEGRAPKKSGPPRGLWAAIGAGFLFLITKGKALLLLLTKGGALLSVFAFLGLYWQSWGWAFALGLLVSIYLHELGHMVALMRYRVPVSAPMFVPGFGAFVRHGALPTPRIGARVALAGPAAGLAAALACYALYFATGSPYWIAIAHLGAIINLGNLLPIWVLDGSRIRDALDRDQRITLGGAFICTAILAQDRVTTLIAIVGVIALFFRRKYGPGDAIGLWQGVAVMLALGGLIRFAI